MAGGYTTPWTRKGASGHNTNVSGTNSGGASGTMPNASNISGNAIVQYPRRECDVWIIDGDDTHTNHFDWVVDSSFTVIINGNGQSADADPGDVALIVQGSMDNATWFTLKSFGNWDPGTSAIANHFVYDLATNGKAPYMRIQLDATGTSITGNDDKPIKLTVHPNVV